MPFKVEMNIPIDQAGYVAIVIDIAHPDQLSPRQRQVLADTAREFAEFGAATLNPAGLPPATIHDPSATVLAGVTGTRRNTT